MKPDDWDSEPIEPNGGRARRKRRSSDPLVDYFFPSRQERRRDLRTRLTRVILGLVVLALVAVPLYRAVLLADSVICSWRLRAMMGHRYTGDELEEDTEAMVASIARLHPRPEAWRTKADLEAAVAQAERAMKDGASRLEAFRLLAPLAAGVRCGHTRLTFPAGTLGIMARGGRFLPLGIHYSGDRAFVVQHFGRKSVVPLGAEVLSINGLDAAAIRAKLLECMSSDGPGSAYASSRINQLFFYYYWAFVDQSKTFSVRCRPAPGGAEKEYEVSARRALKVALSCFRQNPGADPRRPMFPIQGIVPDGSSTAYLRIPTFDLANARGYREALRSFFKQVQQAGITTLVVDVRGNGGGPSVIAVELLRYLVDEPFTYLETPADVKIASLPVFVAYARSIQPHPSRLFRGDLYCLMDGGSFSTTGHFIAALRAHRRVTLMGEESGGGASCTDNGTIVDLPHTRLRLRVARTVFRVPVGPDRAGGVRPDVQVHPAIEDLVQGRDTALSLIDGTLGTKLESAARRLKSAPREPLPTS